MKLTAPIIFCFFILVSFREDDKTDYAAKAAQYYDSISYYPSGSPKYMSYLNNDSSRNYCWFYGNGFLAKQVTSRKTWSYSEKYFGENGQLLYDSTRYGNSVVRRYNPRGVCDDYRIYYYSYYAPNSATSQEHYLLDERGDIRYYNARDSLGNITTDYYFYPFKYLDGVRLVKEFHSNKKTKTLGLVLPREIEGDSNVMGDSVNKTGLWQTYHQCGMIASIGLYFNGVADGLHVTFDTTGVPLNWIYYAGGQRNHILESQILLDTMCYDPTGPRAECAWYFTLNGKRMKDGPDISIQKNGHVRQFIYFYNGNSIGGNVYGTSDYPNSASMFVPLIMGSSKRMGISFVFDRDQRLILRAYEPFLKETFCENFSNGMTLGTRKTLHDFRAYNCSGRIQDEYMFALPVSVKGTLQFDSCKKLNDTTYFFTGGNCAIKKIDGYAYQDLMYVIRNNLGGYDTVLNPDARREYVLLPNGKWFELRNTNTHIPGLHESFVNEKRTQQGFETDMGRTGWHYSWSAQTGNLIGEFYYTSARSHSKGKRWYDNGQLQEVESSDKKGRDHGVEKRYDMEGKKLRRTRYIHGRMYGVAYVDRCECYSLSRKRLKHCRSLYFNDKKLFRLNIICRKRKYIPWD